MCVELGPDGPVSEGTVIWESRGEREATRDRAAISC